MRTTSLLMAATALALVLSAPAANAQPYSDAPSYDTPPETVIVIAPQLRPELNGIPPAEASHLSVAVRYDDLDLTTSAGAHELRVRIRDTARDLCERLTARFPEALPTQRPCYPDAVRAGMLRADNAIRDARDRAYEAQNGYEDGYDQYAGGYGNGYDRYADGYGNSTDQYPDSTYDDDSYPSDDGSYAPQ